MITALAVFFIALCLVGIWTIEARDLNDGVWGEEWEDELDETDGQLGEIDNDFPLTENTAYSWEEVEESFEQLYEQMEKEEKK